MRNIFSKLASILPALAAAFIFIACNLPTLTLWPKMHSDEAWLALLSRDMGLSRDFSLTESFFKLRPRVAHALRLLFHALQAIVFEKADFSLFTSRVISLVCGALCLILLYLTGLKYLSDTQESLNPKFLNVKILLSLFLMLLAALDSGFLYASRFARQEIIIVCFILLTVLILPHSLDGLFKISLTRALVLGLVSGVSVGFHPNGFLCVSIAGFPFAFSFLLSASRSLKYRRLNTANKNLTVCDGSPTKHSLRGFFCFLAGAVFSSGLFVVLSFYFTPDFLTAYFSQGERDYAVGNVGRLKGFFDFLYSVYHEESGTYMLPDVRVMLTLSCIAFFIVVVVFIFLRTSSDSEIRAWRGRVLMTVLCVAGLTLGMMIIGRYNQMSIVFFLVFGYVFVFLLMQLFGAYASLLLLPLLSVFLGVVNIYGISNEIKRCASYDSYLEALYLNVPSNENVIANLNTGFYFDRGFLFDYRDLAYVTNANELESYIKENGIKYILYTDELDFIYENRPFFDVIYGKSSFIALLFDYVSENCVLLSFFENKDYAPRINAITGNPNYATVMVYEVLDKK